MGIEGIICIGTIIIISIIISMFGLFLSLFFALLKGKQNQKYRDVTLDNQKEIK